VRLDKALLLSAALWSIPGAVAAQPAPPPEGVPTPPAEPSPDGPSPETLEKAKQLFFQGNEIRQAGDCQGALKYFLESRSLVPSVANTLNAAVCLAQMGRADEALEMYEELLTKLRERLTDEDRATIGPETKRLRALVGDLDVSADTDGRVVVDGRPRGQLPLLAPLRVLPGKHEVIVQKDGFVSFEAEVEIVAGQTARVRAKLEPLRLAGKLRVEGEGLEGAQLFVDGAPLGTVPWQGSLAPGEHTFWLVKGDLGTAPAPITIVKGQTALASPTLVSLGPELTLTIVPETARLVLDDVFVGLGRWRGRLPIGVHTVRAAEEGYFVLEQRLEVRPTMQPMTSLKLAVDEAHPRWGKRASSAGSVWLEAFGGVGLSNTLGSGAERSCNNPRAGRPTLSCSNQSIAWGPLSGARFGYEFPIRLSLEAAGGYAHATKDLDRSWDTTFGQSTAAQYEITDGLVFTGPFAALGLGYRAPLTGPLELRFHLLVGALFTRTWDDVTGTVTSGGRTIPVIVERAGESTSAPDLFVAPEADLGLRFGGFTTGLGLAAHVFTLQGGAGAIGQVYPSHPEACASSSVECAPGSDAIEGEETFRAFALFTPTLSVGYAFGL
jgi:hypothetical protein